MKRIIQGSFTISIANAIIGALGYAYTILVSHLAGLDSLGQVLAVTGLGAILIIPAGLWTLPVTDLVARGALSRGMWRRGQVVSFAVGSTSAILVFLMAPMLTRLVHLNTPEFIWELLPWIVFAYPNAYNTGVLQGTQRFLSMGLFAGLAPFLKITLVPLLAGSPLGLVAVSAFGVVLATLIMYLSVWRIVRTWPEATHLQLSERLFWLHPAILTGIVTLWSYLDIVLARRLLPVHVAAAFVALASFGKLPFFLFSGTAGVLYAFSVRSSELSPWSRPVLMISLVALGGAVLTALSFRLGPMVLHAATGANLSVVVSLLPAYMAGSTMLAITYAIASELVAHYRRAGWIPLLVASATWVGLIFMIPHPDPSTLVELWLAALCIAAVTTGAFLLVTVRVVLRNSGREIPDSERASLIP